jgi:hypothetical protein
VADLLHSYVIADYERSNFSVSQCVWKEDNPAQIVAINSPSEKQKSPGLSNGAMIAIIVSAVVAVMILGSTIYIYIRVKKRRRGATELAAIETTCTPAALKHVSDISELATKHESISELGSPRSGHMHHRSGASELVSEEMRHELQTLEGPSELQGSLVPRI